MPQERIGVQRFVPFLQNLVFLAAAVGADVFLFLTDINFEATGARMLFKNIKKSDELVPIFALLGIPWEMYSIPLVLACVFTLILFVGIFHITRMMLIMIDTAPGLSVAMHRRFSGGGTLADNEISAIQQMIKTACTTAIYAGLVYLVYMKGIYPLFQLQIAFALWPFEFKPVLSGDAIGTASQGVRDLGIILRAHENEFGFQRVIWQPHVILAAHFLAAYATEHYLAHAVMFGGEVEARHATAVRRFRMAMVDGGKSAISRLRGNAAARTVETADSAQPDSGFSTEQPQHDGTGGAQDDPAYETADEEASPEQTPLRVIGGGETITPQEARKHPGIYVVEETVFDGKPAFKIYTKEFHERMTANAE